MSKTKFVKAFVENYKSLIMKSAFSNAKRLLNEGKLLMNNGYFSRAHHLLVSGLEEIAKANILKKQRIEFSDLKKIISHEEKAQEIFALSAYHYSGRVPTEEEKLWAKDRIPSMLEDTMYVRLKPTSKNQIEPSDKYWRRRAESYYKLLNETLANCK